MLYFTAFEQVANGRSLSLVPSHDLTLGEDVPLHGFEELRLGRSSGEAEDRVQSVELEIISVRSAGRLEMTQWTQVPIGASGSSLIKAKL